MKKLSLFLVAALSFIVAGCDQQIKNEPFLTVSPKVITLSAEGTPYVPVAVSSNLDWVAEKMDGSEWLDLQFSESGKVIKVSAQPNTAKGIRQGYINVIAGNLSAIVEVDQAGVGEDPTPGPGPGPDPTPSIVVAPANVTFSAAGGSQSVTVTANVEFTASTAAEWVSVQKSSGTVYTVSASENTATEPRSAVVQFTGEGAAASLSIYQEGATPDPGPGPSGDESVLALWRCDSADYLEQHSPDWVGTASQGGKGIALPEDGAPAGTNMTWFFAGKHDLDIQYKSTDGNYPVIPAAEGDGYLFTVPGIDFTAGQVVTMRVAVAGGSANSPKNWVIKFRTSTSDEWTVGDSPTAVTTATGVTAHLVITKNKDYSEASRFEASYTVPAAISGATLQVLVCAADGEVISGENPGSISTKVSVRLRPIADYPGPVILVK